MAKIAVISDIHSNLEAFKTVLEDIKKRKLKQIYCTGDIIGYGASPNECINLARKHKIKCVSGNHDFYCIDADDISWFTPAGQVALMWTHIKLTPRNMKFLEKMPGTMEEKGVYFAHGSPRDPLHEYVFPDVAQWDFRAFFRFTKMKIMALGHSHIPFVKKIGKELIFNPGSVGQPRDGNPKASYSVLDTKTKTVENIRLEYDIDTAAKKIIDSGLPRSLADRLYEGE